MTHAQLIAGVFGGHQHPKPADPDGRPACPPGADCPGVLAPLGTDLVVVGARRSVVVVEVYTCPACVRLLHASRDRLVLYAYRLDRCLMPRRRRREGP